MVTIGNTPFQIFLILHNKTDLVKYVFTLLLTVLSRKSAFFRVAGEGYLISGPKKPKFRIHKARFPVFDGTAD
jgi:hypothetical protein